MHIHEMLLQRHSELTSEIAVAQAELDQVNKALAAITPVAETVVVTDTAEAEVVKQSEHAVKRHSMPVNDAVILAVEAGKRTPTDILRYIQNELGIATTLNSVRSRVSPLKKSGRIAHDGTGWIPRKYFGESAPKGESESATTPSPSLNFEPAA